MNIKYDHTTGYIPITDNSMTTVTGLEEISQNVTAAVRTYKGEWFLDKNLGVDYIGTVFKKGTDQRFKELEIKRAILSVPGVISISKWDFSVTNATRTATIACNITCKDGNFPYEVEL